MKRLQRLWRCFVGALSALAFISSGCSQSFPPSQDETHASISNNLMHIYIALRQAVRDGSYFPNSLTSLHSNVDANLFVYPRTGSQPGPISDIEAWADFIYVANL